MLSRPTQPTPDPRQHLRARLAALADRTATPSDDDKLTYRIAGGPPKRRLESTLTIQATGLVTYSVVDALHAARARTSRLKLPSEQAAEIFGRVLESRLLENDDTGGGFLPDSVIGAITVEDGRAAITYYFLAEEQQRQRQGPALNPSLAAVIGVLEQLTERLANRRKRSGQTTES